MESRSGERQAGRRRQQAQEQALDEKLAHEPGPRGTHRGPQRQLALPHRPAREEQARDVRAGDQQEEERRRRDHRHDGTVLSQDLVRQRHREGLVVLSRVVAPLCGELLHRRLQLGGGASRGGAGAQPRRRVVAVAVEVGELVGLGGTRHVELRGLRRVLAEVGGQGEPWRHDADDLVGHPVEGDRTPEDGRVAAEAALPEGVPEDRDPGSPEACPPPR